ncbi:MAG: glycosyltransferase, partial [Alkalinema sp. RU_4_3]|nr:glycosyltransferase [Alkalinema sp. RU_4_3]
RHPPQPRSHRPRHSRSQGPRRSASRIRSPPHPRQQTPTPHRLPLQRHPPSVRASHSLELQDWIDRAVGSGQFDVVTCEHSVNEVYIRPEYRTLVRTVVDIHSSIYATFLQQLETGTAEKPTRDRINLPLLKRYERRYCQKFTDLVVTTTDDQRQIQSFAPAANIEVIPNGVDFTAFPMRDQDPSNHHIMFFGAMDYIANVDAAKYLCSEIFPALQKRYPDATLSIVGGKPTPEIQAFAKNPAIKVTGKVSSMAEYLHQATVCVIPMRIGFGIKNKTLEAMAAGTPVVGSDRGLEGLEIEGFDRALRANTVPEYVEAIGRLFDQADLRQGMSQKARAYVTQAFTWESAGARYEAVVAGS